jgi:hypothetical protein
VGRGLSKSVAVYLLLNSYPLLTLWVEYCPNLGPYHFFVFLRPFLNTSLFGGLSNAFSSSFLPHHISVVAV